MRQSTFFDRQGEGADAVRVVLYALGDFQARGKLLALRDLPLDRLRGAFRRAAEVFGVEELGDEETVKALSTLGASVRRVPAFFAKHPYRVVVSEALAVRSRLFFEETKNARQA